MSPAGASAAAVSELLRGYIARLIMLVGVQMV